MRPWPADELARHAGAALLTGAEVLEGPARAVIDSRTAGPGDLFVGLRGEREDGGRFVAQALERGAWGALVGPPHAAEACAVGIGVVLVAAEPLAALQALATAWRGYLDARVVGITGSTGKTSTKDLLGALLAPHRRTVASRANFNTEIGLPLEIVGAPPKTEALVLEMAMRGRGQIAELARIAEPDVAVIVSVGPVHLELLGSIEAIAATKAELIAELKPGATAIVPADQPLLQPHLRTDVETITFGEGGDVRLLRSEPDSVRIDVAGQQIDLEVQFAQAHLRRNLLAAVAAAVSLGVTPGGPVAVAFGAGRGDRRRLPRDITVIDDSYNANPMSVTAALDDLKASAGPAGRRLAILGDMLELGPDELRYHREIGEHASRTGLALLITVGPLAAAMAEGFDGEVHATADASEAAGLARELLRPGDTVLVKGSRGVGLELVCEALAGAPA